MPGHVCACDSKFTFSSTYSGHGHNCSMQLRRRTEEKFLVPYTGDAVCGAALESWSERTHVPIYDLIERPDRKPISVTRLCLAPFVRPILAMIADEQF